MQVAVFGSLVKEQDLPYIKLLFDALHGHGVNAYVYKPYFEQLKGHLEFPCDVGVFDGYLDLKKRHFDFVFSLGGDGTMLNAATIIRDAGIPMVGINLGRLGFMADIEKTAVKETLVLLQKGMYTVETRSLLYLESNIPIFGETPFALNDFTLLKRDTSSMITIHTYINGSYLNSYWADGLIVATPTGSTGYSLSCGGPIIFPNSDAFVITPVAPHNLNVRPIIIPDSSCISFEVEGRTDNFLCTLDSRFETITAAHQLAVRKCDFEIKLVQLSGKNFLDTIRNKLNWGSDKRN
jgi:NAD+ kinase